MSEWFQQWFGNDYLELYPHRDGKDAADAVGLIAENVSLRASRVLDLACGSGRHSEVIRQRGGSVVGIDLSLTLLRRAREDFARP